MRRDSRWSGFRRNAFQYPFSILRDWLRFGGGWLRGSRFTPRQYNVMDNIRIDFHDFHTVRKAAHHDLAAPWADIRHISQIQNTRIGEFADFNSAMSLTEP